MREYSLKVSVDVTQQLHFSVCDIHVWTEGIKQLKEALNQLELSAAPGVSASVNRAPCGPMACCANMKQASTRAACGIEWDEHQLTLSHPFTRALLLTDTAQRRKLCGLVWKCIMCSSDHPPSVPSFHCLKNRGWWCWQSRE